MVKHEWTVFAVATAAYHLTLLVAIIATAKGGISPAFALSALLLGALSQWTAQDQSDIRRLATKLHYGCAAASFIFTLLAFVLWAVRL
jgi:FtsH-binding integral membrane protein